MSTAGARNLIYFPRMDDDNRLKLGQTIYIHNTEILSFYGDQHLKNIFYFSIKLTPKRNQSLDWISVRRRDGYIFRYI